MPIACLGPLACIIHIAKPAGFGFCHSQLDLQLIAVCIPCVSMAFCTCAHDHAYGAVLSPNMFIWQITSSLSTFCVLCTTGDIMFCDGSCMRAFHCGVEKIVPDPQPDASSNSSDSDKEVEESAPRSSPTKLQEFHCNPLDMPLDLYQHLKDTKDTFHCPNCLAGVHQCFKCKQEGVVEAHAADQHNTRFANQLVFRCSCTRPA